jgi:hypothetical protein
VSPPRALALARRTDSDREPTLGVPEMAAILGVAETSLSAECVRRIETRDFRHRVLEGADRDAVVRQVIAALSGELPVSGPQRREAWERGWADILARFEASGGDPGALTPHYFRRGPMRLHGADVSPRDGRFELSFVAVLHAWLAGGLLATAPEIWEFGCGPGHNLVGLAGLLPGRRFVGLDWANASQALLERIRALRGIDVRGLPVDLFAPAPELRVPGDAAVLTVGAMEQLGPRFEPFLRFLLEQAPAIVVHLEPIHELYDRTSLLDDLAARYAERRGYLQGYLPALERLAAAGRVEILHVKRHLGSLMHDGWGSIVWRPRPRRRSR